MAYIEWFTPFSHAQYDTNSRMYRIGPLMRGQQRQVSVIPISRIRQSIHLFPDFGAVAPANWRASNVLDSAKHFYVNVFSDRFQYLTLV